MLNIQLLHNRKKQPGETLVQVRVFFAYENKYLYISTKVKVSPEFWKNNQVSTRHPDAILLNHQIGEVIKKIRDREIECQAQGIRPTPEIIKQLFNDRPPPDHTLKQFFETERRLQDLNPATATHENRSIETFIKVHGNISIESIGLHEIQKFDRYLIDQGYNADTRYNYHKHIRKYLYRAIDKNIVSLQPYRHFKVKRSEGSSRQWLTRDELDRIEACNPANPSMQRVKDRFLFACYTGLAFSDVEKLTPANFQEIIGVRWIIMERTKTGRTFQVPVISKAAIILKRHENQNPVFPKISNQVFNQFLKDLAAMAGITKKISSHTARHTFATAIVLENGASIESLKTMLGTTSKIAEVYGRIVNTRVKGEMAKLL